jgi:hypothetical protein
LSMKIFLPARAVAVSRNLDSFAGRSRPGSLLGVLGENSVL